VIKAISFLMLFVFANYGRAAVIAQYDFNGNTDDSIRGAGGAGLVTGTASYTDVSSGNKAFHFNGSTYIKAASVVGGLTTMTMSSWVKFDNFSQWTSIMKDDWNNGGPIHFGLSDTTSKLDVQINSSAGSSSVTAPSARALSTGVWYNLAFTFNGTSSNPFLKLYINGDEVGSQAVNVGALSISPSRIMAFGAKLDPSGNPIGGQNLSGDMDGVVFFNTVLSGSEIKAISDGGVGAVPEPSTISMLVIGLAGFALHRRRRS
jgi:hypothetical protein